MKILRILILASAPLAGLAAGLYAAEDMPMPGQKHHGAAPALTAEQKQFLTGYENIRAALADDDLATAKNAAAAITGAAAAADLAQAESLKAARDAFRKLSGQAVPLVKGQIGYYVAHCQMADADWVQTAMEISNPYLGVRESGCGVIKNIGMSSLM